MAIDFPNSPSVNQIYTVGSRSWIWDGSTWNIYANVPNRYIQDAAPSSPQSGDQWFESDTGRLFVYYDSAWVEIGNATDVAGALQPGQVTALSAVTSLTTDDVFPVIDNPSSATAANKITYGNLVTAVDNSQAAYSCFLINTSFSLSNGVGDYVTFSSEQYDPSNWHSTSSNTSRVTPTIPGYYLCTVQVNGFNASGGNYRALTLVYRNRASSSVLDNEFCRFDVNNYVPDDVSASGITYCNGTTDYLEVYAVQYSGGTLSIKVCFNVMLMARA